jgi:hypothetical protein
LVSWTYGDRVAVKEFFAANIILAVTALVPKRKLNRVIGVCTSIVLESVGPGGRASAINGKDLPVVHGHYPHGLIGFW